MQFSRRTFLMRSAAGLGGALAAGVAAVPAAGPLHAQRRPNVVFILADDLGWGDLGCYGHPNIKTPHLDQLARQGTLFTQGYMNGSVCSPSRAAIMTGHFPARHGIHGHFARRELNEQRDMPQFLDPAVPTIPRLFQQAGYRTGHFGKWHLGGGSSLNSDKSAPEPSAYGIDDYRVYVGNGPDWAGVEDWLPRSSELIVDETLAFINAYQARPFFVQTWLKDPHAVLEPTEEQRAPYKNLRGAMETYYAVITNLDRQVGRIFARLEQLGLAQDTLVIFSSDNGPEDISVYNASHSGVGSPGPFRGRKRSLYEGGVRVPFIVRWPGQTPAGRVDNTTVVSGVDLMPTLCSMAGIKLPEDHEPDGEDLSQAFAGESVVREKPLYWEFRHGVIGHVSGKSPILSLREGKWKLMMNPDRSRVELYDIVKDPRELNNLAEYQQEIVERLSARALEFHHAMPKAVITREAGKDSYPWPRAASPAAS